jgi:hypothetical protein
MDRLADFVEDEQAVRRRQQRRTFLQQYTEYSFE